MPCAVICIPDGHYDKCKADIAGLQKKVKGIKFAVAHKPLDAMEKGNELGAAEPNKKCSLYIIHSKFFNITKDPFCATIFKSMQKNNIAGFACGKQSACDKIGKKYHWYMGEDSAWDLNMAAKQCEKLLDGQFTEAGYQGKPLRKKGAESASAGAMGSPMMMGGMGMNGMGGMGGMMGGMGGTMGGMGGTMGVMGGMMGGTGGTMGGANVSGGWGGANMSGSLGGGNMSGGTMGGMGGGMGDMNAGGMGGSLSRVGSLAGNMGGLTGNMADLNAAGNMGGSMRSLSAPLASMPRTSSFSGGMAAMGGMGGMVGALTDAPKSAPVDILTETENMLSQGMPVTEVVKMLANEVQRLSNLVQARA